VNEKTAVGRFEVVLTPGEDGMVIATVPAITGCTTQGKTREEALVNAREAIEASLAADAKSCGCPDAPAEPKACAYDDELGYWPCTMCRCCSKCAHACYQDV